MAEIFSFSTSFMIGSSLPAITDCGPNLYPLLSNSSNANHLFKQTSNASNIAKQAAIFISLIGDVVQSTPADIVTVTPSLHALQQCLRSGWRPDSISNEVLSVSIALLDSDELETSSVAENLLSCGMQTSSALANQILIALATSMQRLKEDRGSENRWLSSTYQRVLSKSLGEFIRHSFRSLLVQAADSALQAAQEPRRSHIAGAGASGLGTEKLGLGDKLEVWVSPDWVVGTIVKSNALTGEFYIEHPVTGLSADHSSSASRAVVVTTLPKTSRMLRLLRTSDDEPHNDEPALAAHTPRPELSSRDIFATEELEGGEQQLRGVADVVALVYGSEDAMSSSGTLQVIDQTSLPHSANRTGRSPKDTPICENGHQCTVSKIDQNSAGFMCSYCSKLYASDFDLPVFGSDPTRFPLSRFALAQYKWSCPGCHFDACLTCFPHPDYPAGGTGHLDRNRDRDRDCSAFDRSSHTKDAAPVKVVNIPEAGQRCTICLLGRNEQSYCRVRAEPSVTSAELSRVSHGSVIDVMDVPGSDFFQLLNSSGGGYVKKQLGKMCYWKRLPRDRYMIHGELEDMVFFDRSEFTPLINLGALNSSGTCSSSSERAFPDSNSSSSARQGSDDAERHQVDMLANLLVLLVHHDSLVKDAFKSFAGGGHEVKSDSQSSNGGDIDPMSEKLDLESSAKRILSTALSLFKKVQYLRYCVYSFLILKFYTFILCTIFYRLPNRLEKL